MGSSGGILEVAEAMDMPAMVSWNRVRPAGVVAAALVPGNGPSRSPVLRHGRHTAKASLIRGGRYETTPEYEVARGSSMSRWMNGTGHPLRRSVIDLAEVSAGGDPSPGLDPAGALRVGRKAPAPDPGPYATPAAAPSRRSRTATSASAIEPGIRCRRRALESYYEKALCRPLAAPRPRSASASARRGAVIDVSQITPWRTVLENRLDPTRPRWHGFVLAAFGGAGPLHAAALAGELGSPSHLPADPRGVSALRLIGTDLKRHYCRR